MKVHKNGQNRKKESSGYDLFLSFWLDGMQTDGTFRLIFENDTPKTINFQQSVRNKLEKTSNWKTIPDTKDQRE